VGFFRLCKERFPYTVLTDVRICLVFGEVKMFESVIYTHFRLQRVNAAVMLPCELAEENHEESDDSLRTKFVTFTISCAVDVAYLRNPRIGLSFQGSSIVLQNRQRPQRHGFSILRHVKNVQKQKRYHGWPLRTEIRARTVC
jgi:hypothetical protein